MKTQKEMSNEIGRIQKIWNKDKEICLSLVADEKYTESKIFNLIDYVIKNENSYSDEVLENAILCIIRLINFDYNFDENNFSYEKLFELLKTKDVYNTCNDILNETNKD